MNITMRTPTHTLELTFVPLSANKIKKYGARERFSPQLYEWIHELGSLDGVHCSLYIPSMLCASFFFIRAVLGELYRYLTIECISMIGDC